MFWELLEFQGLRFRGIEPVGDKAYHKDQAAERSGLWLLLGTGVGQPKHKKHP